MLSANPANKTLSIPNLQQFIIQVKERPGSWNKKQSLKHLKTGETIHHGYMCVYVFYQYNVDIALYENFCLIIALFFHFMKTWFTLKVKLQLAIMCFSDSPGLDHFCHCGKEGNKSLFVPHSLNEQKWICAPIMDR